MLTGPRSAVAGIALALLLGPAPTAFAAAEKPNPKPTVAPPTDCGDLSLCIGAGVDGTLPQAPSTRNGGKPAAGGSSKPGKKPKCQIYSGGGTNTGGGKGGDAGAVTVPCKDPELGSFSDGCYYKPATPQPPAEDPAWKGHKPGDGAIYQRSCPMGPTSTQGYVWMDQPPAAAAVDPAQLAQEALDKMTLKGPDIGITPKPGGKGVVGMPVWMWTEKSAETYGPNSASASAGGITVTATAKVSKIVWKMGDGTSVTCHTAGSPYKASYGKKDSPDCGHAYSKPSSTEPSGKYHVTATATWDIDWEGGGQTGDLTEIRDSDVDITVAEVQVLN